MSEKTCARNTGNKEKRNGKAGPSFTHDNQHGIATGNADPYRPMAEAQFFRVFTPRAVRLALHDLVGHYGIGQDDLPDMVQELLVTAWQASVGYDPDYVSPKTGTRT